MKIEHNNKPFIQDAVKSWEDVENLIQRKIVVYDENIMQVKVAFKKGGVGALHQHPHTQISYIAEGIFEVEISGKKQVLQQGDSFYVAPNLLHGVVCIEDGILIDVFIPYREDFI